MSRKVEAFVVCFTVLPFVCPCFSMMSDHSCLDVTISNSNLTTRADAFCSIGDTNRLQTTGER